MRASVNVLLGVEPIFGQLTGIGHYTKHLATGLSEHDRVSHLQLFAHGRVLSTSPLDPNPGQSAIPRIAAEYVARVRPHLATSRLAVSAYERLISIRAKRNLKRFAETHILHSPSFALPDYPGRSVVTFHDLSTVLTPQYHPAARVGFTNRSMDHAASHADHIITDSEFIRQQVLRHFGIAEDRCTAVPLGADAAFRPRKAEECEAILAAHGLRYKQYCLFVSTIEPRKNLLRLLHAFADCARRRMAPYPLVIVGHPGWRSDHEHKMIRDLQSAGIVKYLGYIPNAIVPVLFSAARLFVYPSMYEGFGLPALEAMQSGTAVITSVSSAMEEVCGAAALTVEPRSVQDITNALELLSQDDARVDGLARAGIARAANYSWSRCVNETLEVYQSLP